MKSNVNDGERDGLDWFGKGIWGNGERDLEGLEGIGGDGKGKWQTITDNGKGGWAMLEIELNLMVMM
jgi:hypothetical protein